MNRAYEDHLSKQIVKKYRELEMRIMEDIIRRIRASATIPSTADWQIGRLVTLGNANADILKIVEEAVKGNPAEVQRIYKEVIEAEYTRDREIYEALGKPFVPYDDNLELIALTQALMQHSNDELYNITRTMGFILPNGSGHNEFQTLSEVMNTHLDRAMMDITSGAFDYNTVIKRTVAQMTASGLRTIEYASGRTNRVDVAARRAVMTGIGQLAGTIADVNAQKLGTDFFEIDWHMGARPTHQPWQGRVYSREELVTVCGLGTVTGLLGANCYHTYYPFIPGVSERAYTDEWLDAKNAEENTPREYKGKEYTLYEALQHQRQLETTMRAQREKVVLLEQGGADEEDIVLAKCKYQATLNEYKNFSREMNLRTQMERVYYDGKGRIAPTAKQYSDYLAKKDKPADIAQQERVEAARREDLDKATRIHDGAVSKTNVTEEYLKNAASGVGKIEKEAGYPSHGRDEEERVAKWLHDTFGGDILLQREYPDRESADYLWRGKQWELKTPEKENSVSKRVQKGLSQIFQNPGGIILDVQKLDCSVERVEEIVHGRLKTSMKHPVDIMIMRGEELLKIFRYSR